MDCAFDYIGIIHTPYQEKAPYQPVEDNLQEFFIELKPKYAEGLHLLDQFKYIYVLFHIHKMNHLKSLIVSPPWTNDLQVGVFASRSPARPNPIGLSVVRIKRIKGHVIHVSGLDVFDGTPLLDIKPYIDQLDVKKDANLGWVGEMDDPDHLALHIRGVPHDF
jgi:tRNA (adenine37-N6)-methyltransferase